MREIILMINDREIYRQAVRSDRARSRARAVLRDAEAANPTARVVVAIES